MRVYTWNIPEIYRFPIYDRYIPGIFHIYDTIQIPDVRGLCRRLAGDETGIVTVTPTR